MMYRLYTITGKKNNYTDFHYIIRKKKQFPIPDEAWERVQDADEYLKYSDYRADGIGHCFFFRLAPSSN